MTLRAARTIATCRVINFAVMIGAAVAVVPTPERWFWIFAIILTVGILQSRHIYVGLFPVQLPNFDDEVAGLMLSGTSEEAAVLQTSRGEASRAIFVTVASALCCAMLDLTAYAVSFHIGPSAAEINAIVGQAALWIVGFGALLFILPFVALVFHLRSTKRRDSQPPP